MAEGKLENEPKPSINASRSLRLAMFLPFFASRFMLIALKRTMKSEGAGEKKIKPAITQRSGMQRLKASFATQTHSSNLDHFTLAAAAKQKWRIIPGPTGRKVSSCELRVSSPVEFPNGVLNVARRNLIRHPHRRRQRRRRRRIFVKQME